MFKNLKLGARIGLGFAGLVLLTCFLGGSNAWQMNGAISQATRLADEYVPEAQQAARFDAALLRVQLAARTYGFTYDEKYLGEANTELGECKETLGALQKLSQDHPALVALSEALPQLGKSFAEFQGLIDETAAIVKALSSARDQQWAAAETWATNVEALQTSQEEKLNEDIEADVGVDKLKERAAKIALVARFRVLGNQIRIAAWKAQAQRDASILQSAIGKFDEMNQVVERLRPLVRSPQNIDQLKNCASAADQYRTVLDGLLSEFGKLQGVNAKRLECARTIGELAGTLSTTAVRQSTERARATRDDLTTGLCVLYAGLGAAVIISIVLGWFITRGITKPVNRIIQSLTDGANQVNDAARQVSSASQQLAAGASEQASSLEETSSALEEMTAMTRTSAENSTKANDLAGHARQAANDGDKRMVQLNEAMTGINESSDKISKIIKVIEEIAFQTNLLALNAAVEAARAGEHGKGFAVVAEEVRNLAQRCAQAAKETTGLIENAVHRAQQGTQVAADVGKSLTQIVDQAAKVSELISGIARASQEQAQGVDQINSAVSQMDKVTQQNAAGAEESASAAEELSAQAHTVKAVVDELTALVRGGHAIRGSEEHVAPPRRPGCPAPAVAHIASPKSPAKAASKSVQKPASSSSAPADRQFAALAETAQTCDSKHDGSSGDLSGF